METIGFIGLGNMGLGMSRNIQRAGYPMVVHDVREDALKPLLEGGARMASSPAEVARLSDVIFTSLPGPKEVEEVAIGREGLLEGIKKGGVYVDLSTSRPSLIRRIEPMFRKKGAYALDGPVSGGKVGAASGNLAIMVGGDHGVYERIKPILDSFGDKAFYAGAVGCGAIAKLVHNMISMTLSRVLAEGMTLGVKAGIEPRALWECVRRGAVGRMSQLHVGLPHTALRGKFDPPSFALKLARKRRGIGHGARPGVRRAASLCQPGGAGHGPGPEPRLGGPRQQRPVAAPGGERRRRGQGDGHRPGEGRAVHLDPSRARLD